MSILLSPKKKKVSIYNITTYTISLKTLETRILKRWRPRPPSQNCQKVGFFAVKDTKRYSNGEQLVKWYRSTFFNITILGLCNFGAPGIWGAMNSLGAGGAQKPYLVNTANALTFCLMVVSCLLSSALVRLIGIKGALIFGT